MIRPRANTIFWCINSKKIIAAKRTVGANIRFYRYFYEFNVLYWYFESNQRKINEKCGKTEYSRKSFFWIDKSEISADNDVISQRWASR